MAQNINMKITLFYLSRTNGHCAKRKVKKSKKTI